MSAQKFLRWLRQKMSARKFLLSLRRKGSAPLLAAIVALIVVSAILVTSGKGVFSALAYVSMALLGIALVLGCLFAFPYAGIWKDEGEGADEEKDSAISRARIREDESDYVNDLRTMLISTVVGAIGLVTILLTYESAKAAADSAKATNQQAEAAQKQQVSEQMTSAGNLMESDNAGIRILGIHALRQLIRDEGITEAEGYGPLASYVRSNSQWTKGKEDRWAKLSRLTGRKAEADLLVGIGSLGKRAPDVQAAIGVLSERKRKPFKVDLRDADLQGAAFGHAWLPGAIFSGAHLDYLDCRTGQGPYADFQLADFQGASLYGAYFNNANLTDAVFRTPVNEDKTRRTSQTTDLRDAHFRGATLIRTDFEAANLAGANFSPTKVGTTNLSNANFKDARLIKAHFEKANLSGADLTGAKLNGANLEGANLRDAKLGGADLSGARYDHTTRWPAGYWVDPGRTVVD